MTHLYFKGTTKIKNYTRRQILKLTAPHVLKYWFPATGKNVREMMTVATDREVVRMASTLGWFCEAIEKTDNAHQIAFAFYCYDQQDKRDRCKEDYKIAYDCGAVSYLEYERRCKRIEASYERLTSGDYNAVNREHFPLIRGAIMAALED